MRNDTRTSRREAEAPPAQCGPHGSTFGISADVAGVTGFAGRNPIDGVLLHALTGRCGTTPRTHGQHHEANVSNDQLGNDPKNDPKIENADPYTETEKAKVRRINALYQTGMTLMFVGPIVLYGYDYLGPARWSVASAYLGVLLFILGGILILIWGPMDRRFKRDAGKGRGEPKA
jgi:hypothetical protein